MYLSQDFLKNHNTLEWTQQFKNKRSIDYGQPVLLGFGAAPFNPVQMGVGHAYGLISNARTGKSLRELYGIWSDMAIKQRLVADEGQKVSTISNTPSKAEDILGLN